MKFTAKSFSELTTTELYEILKSRSEIFMLEQKIYCQDMDDVDYNCRHCFLEENGRVVAYLRAFYNNDKSDTVRMGRVLSLAHGKGLGTILMNKSIEDIRLNFGCKRISLHSQKGAIGFYEKFGFKVTSEEFLEEGVIHVTMELDMGIKF